MEGTYHFDSSKLKRNKDPNGKKTCIIDILMDTNVIFFISKINCIGGLWFLQSHDLYALKDVWYAISIKCQRYGFLY